MHARIYQPTKNAMQSGLANAKRWLLEYEPEAPRTLDPLMGWSGSSDTQQQVRLKFETRAAAEAYAKRKNIPYHVVEPQQRARLIKAYADNFSFRRVRAFGELRQD